MAVMGQTVVGIGTRKGLWLARSRDRVEWELEGPHFLMSEVLSILFDTRREQPRQPGAPPSGWISVLPMRIPLALPGSRRGSRRSPVTR